MVASTAQSGLELLVIDSGIRHSNTSGAKSTQAEYFTAGKLGGEITCSHYLSNRRDADHALLGN